jgi:hypothetical protein
VRVWRGLKGISPSDLIKQGGIKIDSPSNAEPLGGLSVYEENNVALIGYKKGLPFIVSYSGVKKEGTLGGVAGILPDGTDYIIAGGVAMYTPGAGGEGHWTITVEGLTTDQTKRTLLDYAEKYFNKKYEWTPP